MKKLPNAPDPSKEIPGLQNIYAFYTDICQAYREWRDALLQLTNVCIPQLDAHPKHLLIGDPLANPHQDEFRHRFVPASTFASHTHELRRAQLLWQRLRDLTVAFTAITPLNVVKILPSRNPGKPLGQRALPAYYGEKYSGLWNIDHAVYGNPQSPLSFSNAPKTIFKTTGWETDFYRIEGHIGCRAGDRDFRRCAALAIDQIDHGRIRPGISHTGGHHALRDGDQQAVALSLSQHEAAGGGCDLAQLQAKRDRAALHLQCAFNPAEDDRDCPARQLCALRHRHGPAIKGLGQTLAQIVLVGGVDVGRFTNVDRGDQRGVAIGNDGAALFIAQLRPAGFGGGGAALTPIGELHYQHPRLRPELPPPSGEQRFELLVIGWAGLRQTRPDTRRHRRASLAPAVRSSHCA
ncbi:MAG: hypothetical protein HC767_06935 [Akkermansiaceae bacterium]|nr:hypothetical protein [Akkermansiaceae bacterium]